MVPRLSRERQRQVNREAVLDAAVRVFRERGYQGTTLEAIAETAGFSRGVTYSQFSSKADLFLAALERRRAERAAGQHTAAAAGDDPWRSFIDEIVEQQMADPAWILATMEFRATAMRDPEVARRYRALHAVSLRDLAADLAAIYGRTGLAPPAPPDALARVLAAMGAGAVMEETAGAAVDGTTARQAVRAVLGLTQGEGHP